MGKHGKGLRAGPSFLKDQGEQAHSRAGPSLHKSGFRVSSHIHSCLVVLMISSAEHPYDCVFSLT